MINNNKEKFTVISLFSGCGGMDLGFIGNFNCLDKKYSENPFEIVLANDINEKATLTQKHNFKNINVVCEDVVKLVEGKLPKADVLIGGFPCQDFSLAGKQQGLKVERGNLYKSMIKAIQNVKPKVFIAENVKGLILLENGLAIKTIISDFEKCGYNVKYKLFNTADFGVPQLRERVIIVGVRKDIQNEFQFPNQTHFEKPLSGQESWISIKDAIEDLEDDLVLNTKFNCGFSKAKKNNGQGNSITKADRPSPTMRAEHHGNIEFHYKLPRRLSAREAARIQTFPDDFEFLKSTTDAYRQIGNAVPPVFAWHIAKSVIDLLKRSVFLKSESVYNKIFDDNLIVRRVKNKLPKLFQLAELESSRNGKLGMEIGSVRERIIIALLMYKFGIDIVDANLKITESEVDVIVNEQPLSIKTITSKTSKLSGGIKLIWTVDSQKALEFKNNYSPKCDMMLVQIVWSGMGKLILFSADSQNRVLEAIGRDRYIKLPKAGTNPRGAEITPEALNLLLNCDDTRIIEIPFVRGVIDYREVYTKWLDAWRDDY